MVLEGKGIQTNLENKVFQKLRCTCVLTEQLLSQGDLQGAVSRSTGVPFYSGSTGKTHCPLALVRQLHLPCCTLAGVRVPITERFQQHFRKPPSQICFTKTPAGSGRTLLWGSQSTKVSGTEMRSPQMGFQGLLPVARGTSKPRIRLSWSV